MAVMILAADKSRLRSDQRVSLVTVQVGSLPSKSQIPRLTFKFESFVHLVYKFDIDYG